MLKKVFKYKDLETGEEMTEEVYFHLYEADIVKTQLSVEGGLAGMLQKISKAQETATVIRIFDDLISKSVGYKNDRGRFVRTRQFAEEFMSSSAYSDLFIELVGTAEKALEFIKGILPANIAEELSKQFDSGQLELGLPEMDGALKVDKKLEDYTRDELLTMDQALFDALVGTDLNKMSQDHLRIAFQRKSAAQVLENAANKQ